MKSQSIVKTKARKLAPSQGFTLIETLVAVSFGSSIMLAAVSLVHTAFKLQSLTQTRLEQTSTLDRYVEQFRRDVSLADRVELPTEKTLKMFFIDQQSMEYRVDENRIARRSFAGETLQQLEQVQLQAGRTAQFTQSDSGRCVVLDIVESAGSRSVDAPRMVRQIVVGMGRMNGAGGQSSAVHGARTRAAVRPSSDASPSDPTPDAGLSGNASAEEQR